MNLSDKGKIVRISVDAMGGDFAPAEIVKGSVDAARKEGVELLLVGPQDVVESELRKYDTDGLSIQIVQASEYLVEGEHPAMAIRQKRDASIVVATKLVRDGKADAVVGVGPKRRSSCFSTHHPWLRCQSISAGSGWSIHRVKTRKWWLWTLAAMSIASRISYWILLSLASFMPKNTLTLKIPGWGY